MPEPGFRLHRISRNRPISASTIKLRVFETFSWQGLEPIRAPEYQGLFARRRSWTAWCPPSNDAVRAIAIKILLRPSLIHNRGLCGGIPAGFQPGSVRRAGLLHRSLWRADTIAGWILLQKRLVFCERFGVNKYKL